jgi:hypothetical protein
VVITMPDWCSGRLEIRGPEEQLKGVPGRRTGERLQDSI